jgi:hypothetical protein
VPVKDVVGECAMKIGHDFRRTRKRERSRKARDSQDSQAAQRMDEYCARTKMYI